MTIHVDAAYLTDEKTVYPIRIDPTIEVNSTTGNEYFRAIEDVTLNSTAVSAPASGSLYIGNRQNYGITRILMKFPGLILDSIPSAEHITAATVEIRDLMCESESMSISVHRFTGNAWSEDDDNWSSPADWSKVSPNSYISNAMDTKTVAYSIGTTLSTQHRYEFNILSAVQNWWTVPDNQEKGIIFKSNNLEGGSEYQKKTFASFNRSAYQPSVKVTYSTGMSLAPSITTIPVGTTKILHCTLNEELIWNSSNSNVAMAVDGTVTGVSAGTATITAIAANGESATCLVTVEDAYYHNSVEKILTWFCMHDYGATPISYKVYADVTVAVDRYVSSTAMSFTNFHAYGSIAQRDDDNEFGEPDVTVGICTLNDITINLTDFTGASIVPTGTSFESKVSDEVIITSVPAQINLTVIYMHPSSLYPYKDINVSVTIN